MSHLVDLTTQCIRCGFCLESCPTFQLTGEETESPRGRIYLARSAEEGKIAWSEAKPHLDRCLGCLACVPVCPSGVKYGQIFEMARERAAQGVAKKALLSGITRPGLLRVQLRLGRLFPGKRLPSFLSRLLSGERPEADLPVAQPPAQGQPLDESKLPPVKGEVAMLEGCAMRVLFPNANEATRRLLRRLGYKTRKIELGCCGALHAHNGYLGEAIGMRTQLVEKVATDMPLIVNSAGCGAWLKDEIVEKRAVVDVSEFLLKEGLADVLVAQGKLDQTVTYHDACHLAHGQGIKTPPRELLMAVPGLKLVEMREADMCCGSAGIYNVLQPKMARELLNRKWANAAETGASIVAMGNPGCHSWIAQAAREAGGQIEVLHTVEVLERAFA